MVRKVDNRKADLNLDEVCKMFDASELRLKYLYKLGDNRSIIPVQGQFGQDLIAKAYLSKGYKVSWVYPEYDLLVDDNKIARVEVKTAKCWSKSGKSYANVFGLKLENFDTLCIVLISRENEVFKILSIPKSDLAECATLHSWTCANGKHPSFVYYSGEYDPDEFTIAEKKKQEIYNIERKIALDEKPYLFWKKEK